MRRIDDKGREERTVELDPERAPLVKQAFEEYATGELIDEVEYQLEKIFDNYSIKPED